MERRRGRKLDTRRFVSLLSRPVAERSDDWMAQARRDLESAGWSLEGGYHGRYTRARRSRLAFPTTVIELSAMAASAITGCSRPKKAMGIATVL